MRAGLGRPVCEGCWLRTVAPGEEADCYAGLLSRDEHSGSVSVLSDAVQVEQSAQHRADQDGTHD